MCTIIFFFWGGGGRGGGQSEVNSERDLNWDSGVRGHERIFPKTSWIRGWVKAKLFVGGGGTEGSTTPAPPQKK